MGKFSLLGCLETKLHPSFWHLFSSQGSWMMEGHWGGNYRHLATMHAWKGLTTTTYFLHHSFICLLFVSTHPSLCVHVVCPSKSGGWKTLIYVRLWFSILIAKDEKTFHTAFIFKMFYLTWVGVTFLQKNYMIAHKIPHTHIHPTYILFFIFPLWLTVLCTFSLAICFYRMHLPSFPPSLSFLLHG